jgi:hypothetical protein
MYRTPDVRYIWKTVADTYWAHSAIAAIVLDSTVVAHQALCSTMRYYGVGSTS